MLPFLKPRAVAGLIVSKRKPDGSTEPEHVEGDEAAPLEAAAEDLIRAIHSKDTKAVAAALKAAFEISDSEPHVEGPHTNESEE